MLAGIVLVAPWATLRRRVPSIDPAMQGPGHTGDVRITIWVRPGSLCTHVGGDHGGALVVRVSQRAVDGKATEAAMAALAAALGIQRRAITLVAGASSRRKIVDIAGADQSDVSRLLADPPTRRPGGESDS